MPTVLLDYERPVNYVPNPHVINVLIHGLPVDAQYIMENHFQSIEIQEASRAGTSAVATITLFDQTYTLSQEIMRLGDKKSSPELLIEWGYCSNEERALWTYGCRKFNLYLMDINIDYRGETIVLHCNQITDSYADKMIAFKSFFKTDLRKSATHSAISEPMSHDEIVEELYREWKEYYEQETQSLSGRIVTKKLVLCADHSDGQMSCMDAVQAGIKQKGYRIQGQTPREFIENTLIKEMFQYTDTVETSSYEVPLGPHAFNCPHSITTKFRNKGARMLYHFKFQEFEKEGVLTGYVCIHPDIKIGTEVQGKQEKFGGPCKVIADAPIDERNEVKNFYIVFGEPLTPVIEWKPNITPVGTFGYGGGIKLIPMYNPISKVLEYSYADPTYYIGFKPKDLSNETPIAYKPYINPYSEESRSVFVDRARNVPGSTFSMCMNSGTQQMVSIAQGVQTATMLILGHPNIQVGTLIGVIVQIPLRDPQVAFGAGTSQLSNPFEGATCHWSSGIYLIYGITHKIDNKGYVTELKLQKMDAYTEKDRITNEEIHRGTSV